MSKIPDPGLKVRVYNIAHQNFDGHQDLGNCVLSQLVPDAQDQIIALKVDDDLLIATGDPNYNLQAYFSQLDRLNLGVKLRKLSPSAKWLKLLQTGNLSIACS